MNICFVTTKKIEYMIFLIINELNIYRYIYAIKKV